MKFVALTALLLALAAATTLHGQEAKLPSRAGEEPTPTPAGAVLPTPPPQLIPDDVLPAPETSSAASRPQAPATIPELDASFAEKPRSTESENRRLHIEWRKLRNRAQNDPEVKAALARAEAARTDLEKRKLLARYFEIFYRKMIAMAEPEMKGYLLARRQQQLTALPQQRVRPGVALLSATPSPSPSAVPAASTAPPPELPLPSSEPAIPVLLPPPALDPDR